MSRRWHEHRYDLRHGRHTNHHLQNAWNRDGEASFRFDILEYCDIEELVDREQWWIDLLDSRNPKRGYNKFSADRHEISEETRRKRSVGMKSFWDSLEVEDKQVISSRIVATRRANDSYHHTDETKAAISQTKKANPTRYWQGRSRSPETREKLRQANLGKKWSPETREKRRQTALRKRSEIDQRRAVTRVSTLERNG